MKKLLLAVLAGFLVGMTTIATELPSLPIGSTNALVEQAAGLITEIWVDLNKKVSDTEWQLLYSEPIIPYSQAKDGPLAEFISARLKEVLERVIDLDDRSLAGAILESFYGGVARDQRIDMGWVPLFGTYNRFSLKEYGGKLAIPEEAYGVSLEKAVTYGMEHAFIVSNIERAVLVARDSQGRITAEFDSTMSPSDPYKLGVRVEEGLLSLPRDYIVNTTPGEVTIWYKDGTSQVFDLATGKLLSPVATRLTIERLGSGLKLTVITSAGTAFVLEYSSDAGFAETKARGELAAEKVGATGTREYFITPTGEMKFFRARLVEPK